MTDITQAPKATITVLVAEDHEVVREGLARGLSAQPDLQLVAVCATVPEALEAFEALRPDVVLSDYRIAGFTAADLIAATRQIDPDVRVLVLSAFDETEFIVDALAAGAVGYVSKTTSLGALAQMIRKVASGALVLEGMAAEVAVAEMRTRRNAALAVGAPAAPVLSEREVQVLSAVAEGHTNKEIAEALGMSPLTVKTHVSRIFRKLGVRDRAQAVATAGRAHLI